MTTIADFFVVTSMTLFAGQSSSQFLPFHFVYVHAPAYTVPPLTFQARLGGGFRAYLQDDCGVERFEFKCRMDRSEDWKGGNVTSKTGNHWVFEDPELALGPGDRLLYGGTVTNRGQPYPINEDAEWIVPDTLPNAFSPPEIDEPPRCPEEREAKEREPTTKNPNKEQDPDGQEKSSSTSKPNPELDEKENSSSTTTNKPDEGPEFDETDNSSSTPTTKTDTSKEPETEKEKCTASSPTTTTTTTTQPTTTPTDYNSFQPPRCPWIDIVPVDSKEKALQNNLGRLQCELALFATKTARVNYQLTEELINLKKLNYFTVMRLQRLESLLRTVPRGVPYPLF